MRIACVVGARPNFIKMAPIVAELRRRPEIATTLVHTGQHYDRNMSQLFFDQLGLPKPDAYLGVGSGSHAEQTAKIMLGFEPICLGRPDIVLTVGDVNSTVACAIVAAKLGIRVAHVEAGLRSFDRSMPEEINRILTDAISDLLFTPSRDGNANLLNEGIAPHRIHFVGNVLIDSLRASAQSAEQSRILDTIGLSRRGYALLTLHRPSNVDDSVVMEGILSVVSEISEQLPIVWPVHPRTESKLQSSGLAELTRNSPNVVLTQPLGYLDFQKLMTDARMVLTDSGGIQEETTVLGVPCITLRENTERPITVEQGTNRIAGTDPARIRSAVHEVLRNGHKRPLVPELWDGRAAERIVQVLCNA